MKYCVLLIIQHFNGIESYNSLFSSRKLIEAAPVRPNTLRVLCYFTCTLLTTLYTKSLLNMKKIYYLFIACLVLLTGITFSSCEKSEFLKSEKGVMSELNGSWSMIQIPSSLPGEVWTIDNGTLVRTTPATNGEGTTELGRGTISVHTTMTKVEITIDGFPRYNGTWEVVKLDKSVLVIDTDQDGTTGLLEKNFQKL
ncbi:MAG TPA: hypothetical protein PKL85_00575 [Bacteroidia bacterium]|nr:hypothetical protein [Bacteroidia bacterium]